MTDEELLLVDCFMLILNFIKGRGGKIGIQNSILRHVKQLYHRYGITRDEIASRLFTTFQDRKRHLKYDAERASLENYVAWFVYYQLLTIKDQCRQHLKKSKTIPLSELYIGDRIPRGGSSIEPYEREGMDGLTNPNTPEDELIGKELLQMALDFFGDEDLSVLLGARDRADEAERLGVDYYSYCKRLKRKTQRFRSYLDKIGYFD